MNACDVSQVHKVETPWFNEEEKLLLKELEKKKNKILVWREEEM
jgi:hypothetical protein